ncbi:heavy metal-responsive transcriptional regulator [Alkalinema pantanalense CENA528]|uniref:heavy metal-responsive transcriptional regulator n=1 Tax=Alkalinema pantanalense TaxID=1620705 RepID=UPI003D6F7AD6
MRIPPITLLKIGEVAIQSGVPVKTIRYYEELGLLKSADRTEGKFRLFHPNIIARLAFIKRLQSLGLSLQEVRECLSVYDRGELPCHDIKTKLEQHVADLDRRMTELANLRQELVQILADWSIAPQPEPGIICPNLDTSLDSSTAPQSSDPFTP